MTLSENYKNRISELAGLSKVMQENITLTAVSGRSPEGTLSYFVEEYVLKLSSDVISQLDLMVNKDPELDLLISKSQSKMVSNNLITTLFVENEQVKTKLEYLLSISVEFEQNSNTNASISIKGTTTKFTMNSKFSESDLNTFKQNIIDFFLSSFKLNQKI